MIKGKLLKYLSEIIKIIDYGLDGNHNKLLSQIKVLIENLTKDGDTFSAEALSQTLSISKKAFKPQSQTALFERPLPVEKDSRFPLADKTIYQKDEIWIELPVGTQEIIHKFINYYNNRKILLEKNIPVNSSIILYGPPGTGKTKTASYIASMLGLPLITARTDALISSYLGATSKNIRMLMDYAQATPCVLFLDEFDALAKIRDDSNEIGELKRVVVTLLQNIDSLRDVILIAATNHEDLLDKAVWRRFHYKIHISLPDDDIREKILLRIIQEELDKKIVEIFIELTTSMTGADIESLCFEYLKEKALEKEISIARLLQLILMERNPELKQRTYDKKNIIQLIKSKYNFSYEKISIVLQVSKTYVSKVLRDYKNDKKS